MPLLRLERGPRQDSREEAKVPTADRRTRSSMSIVHPTTGTQRVARALQMPITCPSSLITVRSPMDRGASTVVTLLTSHTQPLAGTTRCLDLVR